MSKTYDTSKAKIITTGQLPKQMELYLLVLQSKDHIDDILALQKTVFDDLTDEEKTFIVPKDKAFFEKHFDNGNHVIGVVHNGQLIAQSISLEPSTDNPKTGMVNMQLPVTSDKVAIMQGVLVHPDYRGNALMSRMLDARLQIAKKTGRTDLVAEVAVDNFYSWSVFLKEGMVIHSIETDPSDGTVVYNMHAKIKPLIKQRLKGVFNAVAAKKNKACPVHDIEQQKKLLAKGYVGVAFEKNGQNLIFKKVGNKKAYQYGPKLP